MSVSLPWASTVMLPVDVAKVEAASPVDTSSKATPKPEAVPLFVMVPPDSIVKVEPDKTLKLFATIWKSSAPATLISIWSSVSAVILVSPSASKINSLPFKSESNGPPTAPDISTMKILAPDAGAVLNVICVPPLAKL